MGLREELLEAGDSSRRSQVVEHENMPAVEVRELRGDDALVVAEQPEDDVTGMMVEMVRRAVYDPDTGEPVFQAGDEGAIKRLPASWLMRVQEVANDLSGFEADLEVRAGN